MYHCKTSRKPKLHAMLLCLTLAVTLALLTVPTAAAVKHDNYIADPDGTLSETTIAAIKTINDRLYEEKELRIAVCLTDGTGGESIVNFSRALYDDWKLTEGVLLVFDLSTQVYYGIQSLNIDDVLTNSVLKNIFDQVTEVEFKDGNVDKAVMHTVDALAEFIDANIESTTAPPTTEPAETGENDENAAEEEKPSGFVTFMRVILWTILILVLLAAAVFVAALFNDDLGDFLRTYVFRKGPTAPPPMNDYYDDRLYGQPTRNPNNPYSQMNRQQNQRQPRPGYDPYDDYNQQYRQANGRPNRPQQGQYQGPRQGQQGYPRQQRPQGQRPPQQYPQGYNQNYNRPQQGNPYQMQGQRGGQRQGGNRRPPNGQGY